MRRIDKVIAVSIVAVVLFAALAYSSPLFAKRVETRIMWLNHYDLLPGGSDVTTSFESTSSGVGGGLTALVIHSTTLGDVFSTGGNKVVHMAVETPGEEQGTTTITGVRVCYELTSSASFITQIRLAQVQDPPSVALVLLDDATDLTAPGPVCVNSSSTTIDPQVGPLLLSLRVDFGSTSDKIAVRGLGLILSVVV